MQSDAALARRRAFHTSTGLAEIARAVRKLKAAKLMAEAAAANASMETEGGGGEEAEARTRGGAEKNLLVEGDDNLQRKAAAITTTTPAKAVAERKAMAESKAMAEKAVQLFDLFDGQFFVFRFAKQKRHVVLVCVRFSEPPKSVVHVVFVFLSCARILFPCLLQSDKCMQ